MGASGAKYGIATAHFYWIGAIPAMVFVGVFMMPFYYGSKARSAPEYLRMRFDEKTRGAQRHHLRDDDRHLVRHLDVRHGQADPDPARLRRAVRAARPAPGLRSSTLAILISAAGGAGLHLHGRPARRDLQRGAAVLPDRRRFRAAGLAGAEQVGGWQGRHADDAGPSYTHAWAGMAHASTNRLGVDWFGLTMGLGFVLSFGYWCTDFLVVQRAMAANSMVGGPAHAADRRRGEDVLPVPGHPARPDRHRAHPGARRARPGGERARRAVAAIAQHQPRRHPDQDRFRDRQADARRARPAATRLRSGHAQPSAALSSRPACWASA